jgi:ORF6N domain
MAWEDLRPVANHAAIISSAHICNKIYFLRESRVLLDADLAALYGVTTSNLNKAVQRNPDRFPQDFMFRLNTGEVHALRFQIGISKRASRGGRRYPPYAFTEQGVAMLSSVLRSRRAVEVNIAIMRAFVRVRQMLVTHADLRRKIEEMERRYDSKFHIVFATIKKMLEGPLTPPRRIGFHV